MVAISSVSQPSTVTLPTSGSSQSSAQTVSKVATVRVKAQPSVPNNAQPQKQEQPVTERELKQVIAEVTSAFAGANESVGFGYEKKLGLLYVQVTDNQSGEVIREIPSQDFIRHHIAMREMIGLILDKQG